MRELTETNGAEGGRADDEMNILHLTQLLGLQVVALPWHLLRFPRKQLLLLYSFYVEFVTLMEVDDLGTRH